jgi:hypothetical protein
MSLVIDADGHVEETLPELVDAIPQAMRDSASLSKVQLDRFHERGSMRLRSRSAA